jgi:hypothetical protein
LNKKHQLLAYADDVNILGENIDTTQKNREAILDASRRLTSESRENYAYVDVTLSEGRTVA